MNGSVISRLGSALRAARMPRSEGALRRATPDDGGEWFSGSGESPWDLSGKRALALRADAGAPVAGLYLLEGGRFHKFAETRAWSFERGCALQWLGPDFRDRVLYNDLREGKSVSVICDAEGKRDLKILPMPVSAVARDGRTALAVDLSRPDAPSVWRMSLETGECAPILASAALGAFEEKASMRGATHAISDLAINPSGSRFLAVHRWFAGKDAHARLLTLGMHGESPFTLADEDFVFGGNWFSDDEIVSFCRLGGEDGYYSLTDRTFEHRRLWPSLTRAGRASLGAGGLAVADAGPDKARMQSVYAMDGNDVSRLARAFLPFGREGWLNPRFDRLGSRIMIDAAFEGRRALYELPTQKAAPAPKVLTILTVPMAFDGPTMSTLRYARALDHARIAVDYVALNDPPAEIRDEILGVGGRLHVVGGRLHHPVSYVLRLARVVRRGKYAVVHAHGNSCTLALEMLAALLGGAKVRVAHSENSYCKYLTAHRLLRPLFDHLYTDAYACGAEAGEWLFRSRPFSVARISVETEKYGFDPAAREEQRRALGVGGELLIGCVANFTKPKNHSFLLDVFCDYLKVNPGAKLALAGGGALRDEVEKKIAALGIEKSVLVLGVRTDIPRLLSAFDVMLLPSLWEGFPNVLVEWQCAGLPTFVSDTVTRDAKLTPLVGYLPITSTAPWVESLARFAPSDRRKASEEAMQAVRERGYDIRENARGLQSFYLEAAKRCPR